MDFSNLTPNEQQKLREAVVAVSVLQTIDSGRLGEKAKVKAEHLVHLKVVCGKLELRDFYAAVEEEFEKDWTNLVEVVNGSPESGHALLLDRIEEVRPFLNKLSQRNGKLLAESLNRFAHSVASANASWLSNLSFFLDPFLALENEEDNVSKNDLF